MYWSICLSSSTHNNIMNSTLVWKNMTFEALSCFEMIHLSIGVFFLFKLCHVLQTLSGLKNETD